MEHFSRISSLLYFFYLSHHLSIFNVSSPASFSHIYFCSRNLFLFYFNTCFMTRDICIAGHTSHLLQNFSSSYLLSKKKFTSVQIFLHIYASLFFIYFFTLAISNNLYFTSLIFLIIFFKRISLQHYYKFFCSPAELSSCSFMLPPWIK